MSKDDEVLLALKALVAAALPNAEIAGFDGDPSKPERPAPGGLVIGHPGEPGEPEVDLGPLTYHYSHLFYLELVPPTGGLTAMKAAIGAAIVADRTLGGLCTWIEAEAADRNDRSLAQVASLRSAVVPIRAEYSTSDPLI